MATTSVDCPNHKLNLQMCPCTAESCERRGICCECMNYHMHSDQWPKTACMGTSRPADTLELPIAVPTDCRNEERNRQMCACTYEECERRFFCCACVRNHWKADGTGATACMRD